MLEFASAHGSKTICQESSIFVTARSSKLQCNFNVVYAHRAKGFVHCITHSPGASKALGFLIDLAVCNKHFTLQNNNVGGYNNRGFVEVLAASQSNVNKNWFQGTADAVRQYMWLFEETVRDGVEEYLILSGGWGWDLNHIHGLSGVMICMMMRHSRLVTRSCAVQIVSMLCS